MTISPTLYSSNNQSFCTPPEILNPIYKFKPIGLDPCANEGSIVNCSKFYLESDDGLKQDWTRNHDLSYSNPPYNRLIPKWVDKAIKEWQLSADVLMLIPARTDTKIWQKKIFDTASKICFIEGRLQFYDADTKKPAQCWSKKHQKFVDAKAPFPSALIYWGHDSHDVAKFETIFRKLGCIR